MTPVLFLAAWLASDPAAVAADQSAAVEQEASYDACVACHENLPGKLSLIVEEWHRSMHYANQVTCDGCHGGDANVRREQFDDDEAFKNASHLKRAFRIFQAQASDEGFVAAVRGRNISYFCGKCHDNIKEKHLGSPHGDLGAPTCLYCHGGGSHAIGKSDINLIDPRPRTEGGKCATCHRAATMETVANVKDILTAAEAQLATAVDQYAWMEEHGYKNLSLEQMRDHSQETISQLRQTFHSFNMREINSFASAIKSNADLTQQTYEMVARLEKAKTRQALTGALAVLFLLSFAGLLLYYRETVLHHA